MYQFLCYSVYNFIDTRGPVQCAVSLWCTMFTSCIYIFLRLASKCLNCTRSPEEIVHKIHKDDWKHKINSLKIDSDNFTKLPVTFLVENNTENRVKFAKFFNILLNFSLWLCVVQVAWHNFKRFSRSNDDDKISLAFEISKANEILSLSVERETLFESDHR